MSEKVKILIVEDEMLIGANISLQLNELGYEVIGVIPRGEQALKHIEEELPDIMLLDINLKGDLDGIDTALAMQQNYDIPIIYLTGNTDEAHFNRAKATKPYGFIAKPFKKIDLQRTIELTINQLDRSDSKGNAPASQGKDSFVLSDCIFVKHLNTMVKIAIEDILYIEADRNYCHIYSNTKEYLVVMSLKEMDDKLPSKHFLRIHRSYIINISQIKEIATSHVVISNKAVPITKALKEELLKRLQTI